MKVKRRKKIIIGILAVVMLLVGICLFYVNMGQYKATVAAFSSLSSNDNIVVERVEGDYIAFYPRNMETDTGFIIYPGGKVEAESYAPLAKEISEQGYLVVIPYMPMNLAVFDKDKADDVIDSFSNIKNWAVGGHSLGGVMAADYASENSNIKGLILYASYPQGDSLADSDNLQAVSIWGSEDRVADIEKVKAAKDKLPENTKFIEIKGGNHAGFGEYGEQDGDGEATISCEEQIKLAAEYSSELLNKIRTE